jgi:hypothetical protein
MFAPPRRLVTGMVKFAMMCPAERHSKFVTDLAPEGARLGKANVMCI